MPLTPVEIDNVEFTRASLAKRGYDEDQVDAFLDEVTGEMIRLLEEKERLQRRLNQTGTPPRDTSVAALAAQLRRARRAADEADANAHAMKRELDQARAGAGAAHDGGAHGDADTDRVLAVARRTADEHLAQAEHSAHTLITDARERSQRLVDDALRRSDEIRQAARRHEDDAAAERAGLLRHIDELTRVAERHRAGLRGNLVARERFLEGATGD